jgi:hypothetical protein
MRKYYELNWKTHHYLCYRIKPPIIAEYIWIQRIVIKYLDLPLSSNTATLIPDNDPIHKIGSRS